jgi:signal transduction histidine kinase
MTPVPARPLIRRRVTAWYTGSLFLVLAMASLVLRGVLHDTLDDEFRHSQEGIASLTRAFFRSELPEYKTVDSTVFHVSSEHSFASSRVEFERPDGSRYEPAALRARTTALPLAGSVRAADFALDPDFAPGWTLRVHSSGAALETSQRRIDLWLTFVVLATAAFAALAGWWITGRALLPVHAMSESAKRIGPDTRGARLPVTDARDELGALGGRFNALLDRLDGALAQQRRFLAYAAHELRTPVGRMRSEADLALLDGSDAEARGALRRISQDLEGTSRLVDQLLQLARADAAPIDVRLLPAFLDDLVTDALERWHASAAAKGVVLHLATLEESPARLDVPLAERLLGVLIDNAIRYTPRGGRVTIRVRHDRGALLEVSDSGIGVPAAERAQIFDRFFRGAEARQVVPEGSGLGLPIAKWVADLHGATIAVDDAPEGGARFAVHFPETGMPAPAALADAHRADVPAIATHS